MIRFTNLSGCLLCALLCVALLGGCAKDDDEQLIRAALRDMQQGLEEQAPRRVMAHLAEDFQAMDGHSSRDMQVMMLYYFRQNPRISITVYDQDIRLDGEQADVSLKALLLGAQQLLPERAQRVEVEMRWRKQAGEWKLSRLRWQPGG